MMKNLETTIQESGIVTSGNGKLDLFFCGFKSSDFFNPSAASALYLEIDKTNQLNEEGM
jgi:hypothetical protein